MKIISLSSKSSKETFYPCDVFGFRYVITDGKDILNLNTGEVRTISQYKKDMKSCKNKYEDIYFPSKEKALETFEKAGGSKEFPTYKVSKVYY